jgi:ABC-2 type transport system permease protein
MGWALGLLVSGIVLRYGLGAESMAWVAIFAVQPISGVYYPIETLPSWLRPVAYAPPSSHVFEGMRAVLFEHVFRADLLWKALALNALYLALGVGAFLAFFRIARQRGQLLQVGE